MKDEYNDHRQVKTEGRTVTIPYFYRENFNGNRISEIKNPENINNRAFHNYRI